MIKSIRFILRNPAIQLTVLAVVSFAIYTLAFVRPYNLFELWSQPGLTIARISNNDPVAGIAYVAPMLALFLLYWLACRLVLKFRNPRTWAIVIVAALAFNVAMLALYPVEADDIFVHILRGRIQGLYGGNPFYDRPSSSEIFRNDPLYKYSGWHDFPSAYGPGWEMIAAGVARLPGNGVVANVIAFKLVQILATAATGALIALTLRRRAPERALYGLTLFAWNPLVIYSIAGNGHNDGIMLFFLVLGFYFLARGKFTLAAWAVTVGALVKLIPAFVFPVIIIAGLKQLKSWQARSRYLVVTGIGSGVLTWLTFAQYWRGPEIFTDDWRAYLFTTSLPSIIRYTLQEYYDPKFSITLVSRGALIVFALWIGWQSWILWRRRDRRRGEDWQPYVNTGISILLFYLLVAGQWFQPWYAVWALALAALLPNGVLARGAIVLSLAAIFRMPILDFVLRVGSGNDPPELVREWQVTTGTLSIPWIYFVYHWLKGKVMPQYAPGMADNRQLERVPTDE